MAIAKKYIKQWEAEWKSKQLAGTLPKGYASSAPMSKKEYVQRQINKVQGATRQVNKDIKTLEKQLERSQVSYEKEYLEEELEKARFYKAALKYAASKKDIAKIEQYQKEAKEDIEVDTERLKPKRGNPNLQKQKEAVIPSEGQPSKADTKKYLQYLGISKHEKVTLKDGSEYSMEDLVKAFEKHDVNIREDFFKEDVTGTKYNTKIYNKFIGSVENKLKSNFGSLERLTDRDKEGMELLIGFKGVNATLKY